MLLSYLSTSIAMVVARMEQKRYSVSICVKYADVQKERIFLPAATALISIFVRLSMDFSRTIRPLLIILWQPSKLVMLNTFSHPFENLARLYHQAHIKIGKEMKAG